MLENFAWGANEGPTPYQRKFFDTLKDHRRVAQRGPRGGGKSFEAAMAVLWFALTREAIGRDWKVVTTASAWRQLTKYLWPEIHKWARKMKWGPRMGRGPLDPNRELIGMSLRLEHGEAFAVASDKPESIEGAHADSLLYVFDEAKAIPDAVWDSAEGTFSGGNTEGRETYVIALSTPWLESGRFYEICSHKIPGWEVQAVTLPEVLAAGRVDRAWVESCAAMWGVDSAAYKNHVLGEFARQEDAGLIPIDWLEAAVARWKEAREAGTSSKEPLVIGADIAEGGTDKTSFALRRGMMVEEVRRFDRAGLMETAGRLAGILDGNPGSCALIDVIGIGAGVMARLREMEKAVFPFNAAEGTPERDTSGELGFANRRAWGWWRLREALDPGRGSQVALPPDPKLIGDLCAPKWRVNSSGKIQIEAKDEIRKRLGRSPDDGDAVMMAFSSEWEPDGPSVSFVGPEVPDAGEDWRDIQNPAAWE